MLETARFLYHQLPIFWYALAGIFFLLGLMYANLAWRSYKRKLRAAQREKSHLLRERSQAIADRQRRKHHKSKSGTNQTAVLTEPLSSRKPIVPETSTDGTGNVNKAPQASVSSSLASNGSANRFSSNGDSTKVKSASNQSARLKSNQATPIVPNKPRPAAVDAVTAAPTYKSNGNGAKNGSRTTAKSTTEKAEQPKNGHPVTPKKADLFSNGYSSGDLNSGLVKKAKSEPPLKTARYQSGSTYPTTSAANETLSHTTLPVNELFSNQYASGGNSDGDSQTSSDTENQKQFVRPNPWTKYDSQ